APSTGMTARYATRPIILGQMRWISLTNRQSPGRRSDDHHAGVLGLLLGLDVDRYQRVGDLNTQGPLDPVANFVRHRHRHRSGHDEVELDEGHTAGAAR